MIGLVDHDHFEPLPRILIHLLRLRDLLEQILHDDAIAGADVARRDLEVVDGGDDVEFELAVRRRLEDAGVDFDLLDAGAVEGAEGGDDAGLLAGAGRAVHEEVREVGGLGLEGAVCTVVSEVGRGVR